MALILGFVLALVAVLLVLEPLLRPERVQAAAPVSLFADSDDEDDPTLARRDRALAALKEIDFDRATGKLSDEDYEAMKSRFTAEALEALKAVDAGAADAGAAGASAAEAGAQDNVELRIAAARSASHVPRPTPHARFCLECGSALEGAKKFCLDCGAAVESLTH